MNRTKPERHNGPYVRVKGKGWVDAQQIINECCREDGTRCPKEMTYGEFLRKVREIKLPTVREES